ncbi:hypothetical protein L7F22_040768 [Adiantum nelumboides]|nr:hypothetical protein [Adiantum nelumboides]
MGAVQDWRRGTISLYGKTGAKKLYNMDTRKVLEEPYEDEDESRDEDYSTVSDKDNDSVTSSDEDVDVAFLLMDKEIHDSGLVAFANEIEDESEGPYEVIEDESEGPYEVIEGLMQIKDYIDGNQEEMPELPDVNPTAEQIKAFKDWNQGAKKVMYWLSISVQDTMIGHIQDATSPKQAWDRLVSVDTTNTKARKIQLKNELNTVKKENLSINDYTLKIKGIVESLASIGVQVEDDDKVEVCLRGLTPAYKQFG